jgi:hypothetical protein
MEIVKFKFSYGEVGIDTEASPGNGPFYAKLYDGSYDACGFYSLEEALDELQFFDPNQE